MERDLIRSFQGAACATSYELVEQLLLDTFYLRLLHLCLTLSSSLQCSKRYMIRNITYNIRVASIVNITAIFNIVPNKWYIILEYLV